MTKQRQILLDIILEGNCSSCKEIYYKASVQDKNIGTATVYRMINMLEEIGAISRENLYKICYTEEERDKSSNLYEIQFDDDSVLELSGQKWRHVVSTGLKACGYMDGQQVINIMEKKAENTEC